MGLAHPPLVIGKQREELVRAKVRVHGCGPYSSLPFSATIEAGVLYIHFPIQQSHEYH